MARDVVLSPSATPTAMLCLVYKYQTLLAHKWSAAPSMTGSVWVCVCVTRGVALSPWQCDICSNAEHGVLVHDPADPQVERCTIHVGKSSGMRVWDQGRGTFTECDIHSNAKHGVYVEDTA